MRSHPICKQETGCNEDQGLLQVGLWGPDRATCRGISRGVGASTCGGRQEGQEEGSRAVHLGQTPLGLWSRNEPSALL